MFGYAELHAHSAFSFLDGASQPEELVAAAKAMDLRALALTDHNGFYGAVRFPERRAKWGCPRCSGRSSPLPGPRWIRTRLTRPVTTCSCSPEERADIAGCRGRWRSGT